MTDHMRIEPINVNLPECPCGGHAVARGPNERYWGYVCSRCRSDTGKSQGGVDAARRWIDYIERRMEARDD